MFLERIEITGYRGISRLSLNLGTQSVLIGENSWGKSSLLRALWCILGNGNVPYEFVSEDFYKEVEDFNIENDDSQKNRKYAKEKDLSMVLTFREVILGASFRSPRLGKLKPAWIKCKDTYSRIYYFIQAHMNVNGTVFTTHSFLDANGNQMKQNMFAQVQKLLELNPVFRIRDSRKVSSELLNDSNSILKMQLEQEHGEYLSLEQKISKLFTSYVETEGESVPPKVLKDGIKSINLLLEHYFTVMPPINSKTGRYRYNLNRDNYRSVKEIVSRPMANDALCSLALLLKKGHKKTIRYMLALIAGSMIAARGERRIDKQARPIVIFEDIESRLHPTSLINLWHIIDLLPTQKIITTNSGDLLSSVNLSEIRRMSRKDSVITAMAIDERKFNNDELRKIAFHIRINRPMSLFARCWVFVEGETEIWLLNEFASILGISLQAEGIRLVEYAQCGIAPLIKLSNQLGITWHVLADGDEAGVKYARVATTKGGNPDRVTLLPSQDIEHFLYENGFEHIYRENTGLPSLKGMNESKIIEAALRRNTKPGMALAVADYARMRGRKIVPMLFQKLFANLLIKSMYQ